MSDTTSTNDSANELMANLLPDGDWGTITVGDLGERMEHARQQGDTISNDVLAAYTDAKIAQNKGQTKRGTATGVASPQFDDDELDAYGTGIQGDDGETPEPRESTKVIQAQAEQARRSASLDDYGTGMADLAESRGSGGTTTPEEELAAFERDFDGELDAYGTGVEGDTSRAEYKRRKRTEEQAEAIAAAIETKTAKRETETGAKIMDDDTTREEAIEFITSHYDVYDEETFEPMDDETVEYMRGLVERSI